MDPATITVDEYDRLRAHGYAGPASELAGEWPTSHWRLQLTDAGTALVPVELER